MNRPEIQKVRTTKAATLVTFYNTVSDDAAFAVTCEIARSKGLFSAAVSSRYVRVNRDGSHVWQITH
jgi:hypothetical protein